MNRKNWGGWLPWNRHFVTDVVSLAEAARPSTYMDRLDESVRYRGQMIHCHWCGQQYQAGTGPDWPAGYCTQVCVDAAGLRSGFDDE